MGLFSKNAGHEAKNFLKIDSSTSIQGYSDPCFNPQTLSKKKGAYTYKACS